MRHHVPVDLAIGLPAVSVHEGVDAMVAVPENTGHDAVYHHGKAGHAQLFN